MPDPSAILQRIYAAGFELQTFERYPKAIGVSRGDCMALLVPAPDGLQIIGSPGWKIDENLAVLTSLQGERVFQFKGEVVPATPERLAALKAFSVELKELLALRAT